MFRLICCVEFEGLGCGLLWFVMFSLFDSIRFSVLVSVLDLVIVRFSAINVVFSIDIARVLIFALDSVMVMVYC